MPKKKILVVDDSEFAAKFICNILTAADFQVVTANNGRDGIRLVKEEHPDLILLDVIMPETNGFEVFRILKDDPTNFLLPVIMLTSQDNLEDKLEALELGADDYITKPFHPREVLSRVRNTLKRIDRNRFANPLTGLRGNVDIESEISFRIAGRKPFSVIYGDLDNFKPFNDYYGFALGDAAIKLTADILVEQCRQYGNEDDLVGHIGGDDYVIVTRPENAEAICIHIIQEFDEKIRALYCEEDLNRGYILAHDRNGVKVRFSVISISLAVISNERREFYSHLQVSEAAAEIKKKAKSIPGSIYTGDLF